MASGGVDNGTCAGYDQTGLSVCACTFIDAPHGVVAAWPSTPSRHTKQVT
jgi:hypothetical protein